MDGLVDAKKSCTFLEDAEREVDAKKIEKPEVDELVHDYTTCARNIRSRNYICNMHIYYLT